jgi:hypothetical protein
MKISNYYSVIRYVPNVISEEFINIGVYVFNSEEVRVRFIEDWDRARSFGNQDIEFLLTFRDRVVESTNKGELYFSCNSRPSRLESFTILSNRWINSIQITQPRRYLYSDIDYVLEDLYSTYINE